MRAQGRNQAGGAGRFFRIIVRDGELFDLINTGVILRMDQGITAQEIEAMTYFQYELTCMMIGQVLERRANTGNNQ